MTLEEVKRLTKTTLTPAEVISVIGGDPQFIRDAAKDRPELLGFPVIRYGTRTKIPREAFITFMEGRR